MNAGKITRDHLIEVTARLVKLKGFDRTSVQDVMNAAGVGKGSFYHHFDSKDTLCIAVLEQDRTGFMQMLDECFSESNALLALDGFFRCALNKHSEAGFVGGCLWGNTALEMSDSSPLFVKITTDVFQDWIKKVETVIRRGQDQGAIRSDVDAFVLAQSVVAIIEGGIMLSRLSKDAAPFRNCLSVLRNLILNT